MKLFSSLRTSLILIVLIAIIPSILIILLSGIENRQNLLERSREQAAHTSMQAAGQLARFVEGMRYLLTAISENDAVRSRDTARAGRFLSEIMKHFDHLANLGVLDAGGNVFASGIPLKRAVNLSERLYVKKAMNEARFVCGVYQVGIITGQPTINFAYPLMNVNKTPEGVAYAALKLDHFAEMLSVIPLPDGSELAVLDTKGTVLYSRLKDIHKIGERFPEETMASPLATPGDATVTLKDKDGIKRIYSRRSVTGFDDIHVLVGLSEEEAMAGANSALVRNFVVIGILSMIAAGFTWGLGNVFIMKRIRALMGTTDRIAGGNFNARTGIPHDEGELGHLAGSFDSMAESLQARDAQIRESEEKYRKLLENINDVVYSVDEKGVFTYLSPPLEKMGGYRPEEVMGTNFIEFVHPLDRGKILSSFKDLMDGKSTLAEFRVRDKEGNFRWVESSGRPMNCNGVFAGVSGVLSDIQQRKTAEMGRRESEERYRTIVQNTHEGILIIDNKQRIIFANDQIMMISGYDAYEQLGMSFINFLDDSCKAEIIERYKKRLRGEPVPSIYEAVILRKDGGKRNVEVRVSTILNGEGEENFIVQLLDITERKIAEQEKIKLEHQILQTQKLESLGVLAGGIAHDFNNILMAILGHADLAMLELPDTAPAKESLHEIVLASRRAADLCRQMLAYSGRALFVVEHLHLNELIEEMVFLLRTSISKKAILNLNLSKNDPTIRGDATQIRQIIMNLITNASEALEERSGGISITTGEIDCDAAYLSEFSLGKDLPEGRYVMLEVSDTGKGMDQQTVSRIFEPFFTTKFTGRGLGLAAVLGIVRGHKGALKVYSEPGRGTTFKVLVPSGGAQGIKKQQSSIISGEALTEDKLYGSILLVDDEEAVRSLGKRMLEKIGYNAVTCSDGREAVTVFQELKDSIVCVILDLTMPTMDGYETFRELRRIRDDIPVILSSGYTQHEVLQRFAGRGLSGFIQKPYTLENLNMELRRVLDIIIDAEEEHPR